MESSISTTGGHRKGLDQRGHCPLGESSENSSNVALPSGTSAMTIAFASLVETDDPTVYDILTRAPGPEGRLPLTEQMLRESPSGNIFGLTQDVGMGWRPDTLNGQEYLILSTQGGIRA